jgi:hypothetical protein
VCAVSVKVFLFEHALEVLRKCQQLRLGHHCVDAHARRGLVLLLFFGSSSTGTACLLLLLLRLGVDERDDFAAKPKCGAAGAHEPLGDVGAARAVERIDRHVAPIRAAHHDS